MRPVGALKLDAVQGDVGCDEQYVTIYLCLLCLICIQYDVPYLFAIHPPYYLHFIEPGITNDASIASQASKKTNRNTFSSLHFFQNHILKA